MFYEILALEIHAKKAGMEVIKPSTVAGTSGVVHKFNFLASKDSKLYGFDLYPDISEIEVLRTFTKEIDTKANVAMVCMRGKPTTQGLALAKEYGLQILTPADIDAYFEGKEVQVMARSKAGSQLTV